MNTLIKGLLLFGVLFLIGCDDTGSTTVSVPVPPAHVTPRVGVGVAIVVDVSGSMADEVKGEVKEVTARKCVNALIQKTEDFTKRNPDKIVELGIIKFDDEVSLVIPIGKPNAALARPLVEQMKPSGSTAIGNAVLFAKGELDKTGLSSKYIIVVTDGENSYGPSPASVANSLKDLPADQKPTVFIVAFDTASGIFTPLKNAGWNVFSASDGTQLQQTLDQVFGENILLEK